MVLAGIGTRRVRDAPPRRLPREKRSLAHPLTGSTGPGDRVIADRGFWPVEFAHVFTAAGADLLVRLQSNHLGTAQEENPDGSRLSMARPGKDVRLRAAREVRILPKHVIYRVITFAKGDKVAYLGTTLLDPEPYPAAGLVALYREHAFSKVHFCVRKRRERLIRETPTRGGHALRAPRECVQPVQNRVVVPSSGAQHRSRAGTVVRATSHQPAGPVETRFSTPADVSCRRPEPACLAGRLPSCRPKGGCIGHSRDSVCRPVLRKGL